MTSVGWIKLLEWKQKYQNIKSRTGFSINQLERRKEKRKKMERKKLKEVVDLNSNHHSALLMFL